MNIAIVENNTSDAAVLVSFLNEYQKQYSLEINVSHYYSGEAFLASSCEKAHLIFMDIYLEGIDGIEAARQLTERNEDSLIVFLTTSNEEIWRAVKMHVCFDYIEKSTLEYSRIEEILNTAWKRLRLQTEKLEFYNGKQKVCLPISQIQYLVSSDKYTLIVLRNGQEMRCRVTFSSLYAMLEKEARFLLCNRGILLNMDFIRQADREVFVMADGQPFPIRKRNNTSIMQRFRDYQFEKLNEEVR